MTTSRQQSLAYSRLVMWPRQWTWLENVRGSTRIWPVAVEQGRIAGANMAGRPVAYRGSLGRNVMRIFGLDVMTGGIVTPPEHDGYSVLSRFDPIRKTFRRVTLQGDTLVGLVMVGRVEQGGVLLSLIQRGLPLTVNPESLLEPSFNCGTLLA